MRRFWKVIKIVIMYTICFVFMDAAMNATTPEWAILCTFGFALFFCKAIWDSCQ